MVFSSVRFIFRQDSRREAPLRKSADVCIHTKNYYSITGIDISRSKNHDRRCASADRKRKIAAGPERAAAPAPGKGGRFWRQADRRPGRNKKNRRRAGQTAPVKSPAKRRKWDGPRPDCRKKAANGSGRDRSKRNGKRPANPGPPFSPGRRKAGTRKRMGKAEAKRPVPVLP